METYMDSEWCEIKEDHIEVERMRDVSQSTWQDLDLHRLKCSLCGKIKYYSKAAKDFYTKGIKSEGIKGLY